jgi:hypothetical protein
MVFNMLFICTTKHVLNLVLSQSLNYVKECSIIFSSLNGTCTFISHSAKRIYALTEYLKRNIPSLAAIRWSFSSHLVNVTEEHRILIMSILEAERDRRGGVQVTKWQ